MRELILGGARSGKSRMAETKAKASGLDVTYIATATVYDDEMQQRINKHRHDRPDHWALIEEPIFLGNAIQLLSEDSNPSTCILIDCLTLWVTNLLMKDDEKVFREQKKQLLHAIETTNAHLIMVSNETGMGVIPMGQITRRFVDETGWLHQEIAAIADEVTLSVAGLPHVLKSAAT
ncbi:bifunctional adenosylcobinamide kinase/adenosylcobinamide-phosphate guanylyltransferase [Gammaproteobacteria bacterium 45_16_T64]|nr:bifunctional adenosylcobinamide kinase/adenosylcobinamide-phosphate guanylyltransferase [Gammaproteobacteria bacterium 45_16_T64]